MDDSDGSQAEPLSSLPDDVVYALAGPSGHGLAAFNHFYRHLTVVDLAHDSSITGRIGTPDFTIAAARMVFNAAQLESFCRFFDYFRPHTLEFQSLDEYLAMVDSMPKLLESAARIHLTFNGRFAWKMSPGTPGLLANIRQYSCVLASRFEDLAQSLERCLPQLEELSYEFKPASDYANKYHRCHFDHPTLRKLVLKGRSIECATFVVSHLPKSVDELSLEWATMEFKSWASPLPRLKSVMALFRFPHINAISTFPFLSDLAVMESELLPEFDYTLGEGTLQSLAVVPIYVPHFQPHRIASSLTKLHLEFFGMKEGEEVQFAKKFPQLRELTLSVQGAGRIAMSGSFPALLRKLDLSGCSFDLQDSGCSDLEHLTYLRLKDCVCGRLWFPRNLTECFVENTDLGPIWFPPYVKTLTLDHGEQVKFNLKLETLTLTLRAGQEYHNLPDLRTLILRPAAGEPRFRLSYDTITLPASLESLSIEGADASDLDLPSSLVDLRLVDCCLTQFPKLPELKSLNVANNDILLPSTLPPGLRSLDVSGNKSDADLDWSASGLWFLVASGCECNIAAPEHLLVARSNCVIPSSPVTELVDA